MPNKSMIVNNQNNAYYDRKGDGYHHRAHQSLSNAIPQVTAAPYGDYNTVMTNQ